MLELWQKLRHTAAFNQAWLNIVIRGVSVGVHREPIECISPSYRDRLHYQITLTDTKLDKSASYLY